MSKNQDTFSWDEITTNFNNWANRTPTFGQVFQSLDTKPLYYPEKVVVLCSPVTYSSGYGLMYSQYRAGALLIGTASTQASNSFGDIAKFELQYSGITGTVSHDYIVHFPDDPEKGKMLRPQYEMAYEKLKSYMFDPNAEILFALELLENM